METGEPDATPTYMLRTASIHEPDPRRRSPSLAFGIGELDGNDDVKLAEIYGGRVSIA